MTAHPSTASGPPLVYIPGLDGSGELLFVQEKELARRFRLVRVPLRTARPFDYDDLVGDVLSALDAEGIDRAVVLGESFGGSIALQLALRAPERLERLVLVSAFAWFRNRPLLRFGVLMAGASPSVLGVIRRTIDIPTLAIDGVPASIRSRFVEITRRQPLDGYMRRLELLDGYDLRPRLAEIDVPTLVVAGERDRLVVTESARELARGLGNAALRILPEAGHACLLNPAVSLARLIDEWEHTDARGHMPPLSGLTSPGRPAPSTRP